MISREIAGKTENILCVCMRERVCVCEEPVET